MGEKTAELLGRLAIRTVGDLGRTPPTILERLIGAAAASHLGALARGVDDRRVEPYEQPKSIGHEETFDRDLDDEDEILRELLALSGRVAARLREDGYRGIQFNAVVESNQAAVRLWQELGFQIIGTVPEAFTHPTLGRVGLHIMHLMLQ